MNRVQNKIVNKSIKNISTIDLNKQNIKPVNSKPVIKQKEALATDCKTKRNYLYDDMISQTYTKLQLPKFLMPKVPPPPQVQHYETQILKYLVRQHEQYDISAKMKKKISSNITKRIVKIDKIYKVYKQLKLKRKTFELAVYYFDKFLSETTSSKVPMYLQETCLLMAMKYEEIYPPPMAKWTTIVPNKLIELELKVLLVLNFKLAYTTTTDYLDLYYSYQQKTKEQKKMHQTLLEFYLILGQVYSLHPQKIAEQIVQSFRPTLFIERDSTFYENDKKLKSLIKNYNKVWQNVILAMEKYECKQLK